MKCILKCKLEVCSSIVLTSFVGNPRRFRPASHLKPLGRCNHLLLPAARFHFRSSRRRAAGPLRRGPLSRTSSSSPPPPPLRASSVRIRVRPRPPSSCRVRRFRFSNSTKLKSLASQSKLYKRFLPSCEDCCQS